MEARPARPYHKGADRSLGRSGGEGDRAKIITDGIDTAGTAGKLVFHIMAAMAEMERDLVRERTTAALIVARREGRVGGRKTVMTPKRIEAARKLLSSGMTAREIAPTIGVSLATLYRHLPAPEQEAISAEQNVA